MTTRRYFFFGLLGAAVIGCRRGPGRKILIVLVDGLGPEYFEKSELPNLKQLAREGWYKVGEGVIPSVTNVNNASLVTASFPRDHGITTNFYHDRNTGQSFELESSEFLLCPTIFERAREVGWRTALVTSKDKVRTLCARGVHIQVSAERPDQRYLEIAGHQENMYSADVNYWSLRAARHVLKNESIDLLYLSTTDYMMHTYTADDERSLEHMKRFDELLGEIVDDHPQLEVYLTADHGMSAKHEGLNPELILKAKSIRAEAIPIIRDKHRVHHKNLGGACYIYLERSSDLKKAIDVLTETTGIDEVYDSETAARLFRLHPERIGDIFLLAAKDVAFGQLEGAREEIEVRSHGSRYEATVPLLAFGAGADTSKYEYNLDLTANLVFERG